MHVEGGGWGLFSRLMCFVFLLKRCSGGCYGCFLRVPWLRQHDLLSRPITWDIGEKVYLVLASETQKGGCYCLFVSFTVDMCFNIAMLDKRYSDALGLNSRFTLRDNAWNVIFDI